MSHADSILAAIANPHFKKTVEDQMMRPFPLLGSAYLGSGHLDAWVSLHRKTPLYQELSGSVNATERVILFALSDVLGMPARVSIDDEKSAVYIKSLKESSRGLHRHIDVLRDAGCSTVGAYQHFHADKSSGMHIHQLCLYVPKDRIEPHPEDGRPHKVVNYEDQGTFIAYLVKQKLLSFKDNENTIRDCIGVWGLFHAEEKLKCLPQNSTQLTL